MKGYRPTSHIASHSALANLGVITIGDCIRLRELCTKFVCNQRQTDQDNENAAASGTTLSCRDSVKQERILLFQPSRTAKNREVVALEEGKKRKNSCPEGTWTVQFVD